MLCSFPCKNEGSLSAEHPEKSGPRGTRSYFKTGPDVKPATVAGDHQFFSESENERVSWLGWYLNSWDKKISKQFYWHQKQNVDLTESKNIGRPSIFCESV